MLFVQSIDYTRTRLGVDARNPSGQRQFSGIIDCYVKTVKSDGVRGLYRGFWISCACIFIYRYFVTSFLAIFFSYFHISEDFTSDCMIQSNQWVSWSTSLLENRDITITGTLFAVLAQNSDWIYTFLLGWVVTIVSGISAYPLDTIKRRMMMTAGQTSGKYQSSLACAKELVAREGLRAFFKGAGVNIVRGVAGAGVLSGSDKLKKIYITRKELGNM